MRSLVIAFVIAAMSGTAFGGQVDFVFTSSKVIATKTGASLSADEKISKADLLKRFPGYRIQESVEEGETVWSLDRNGHGLAIWPGQMIQAGENVTDGVGAMVGDSLANVFKAPDAKCWEGLDLWCESEFSPKVSYSIDNSKCPDTVKFYDFTGDNKRTPIDPCMVIGSIMLQAKTE